MVNLQGVEISEVESFRCLGSRAIKKAWERCKEICVKRTIGGKCVRGDDSHQE